MESALEAFKRVYQGGVTLRLGHTYYRILRSIERSYTYEEYKISTVHPVSRRVYNHFKLKQLING